CYLIFYFHYKFIFMILKKYNHEEDSLPQYHQNKFKQTLRVKNQDKVIQVLLLRESGRKNDKCSGKKKP
ncbi:hypothetical protein, partial [Yersinia alsatica]|uniref:hypothetical protein n=1 Tax=Yersinia alsatica TaxID=2890317 RepID=UPI001C943CD4